MNQPLASPLTALYYQHPIMVCEVLKYMYRLFGTSVFLLLLHRSKHVAQKSVCCYSYCIYAIIIIIILLCGMTRTCVSRRFPPILNPNIKGIQRQLRAFSTLPHMKEPPRYLFNRCLGGLHSPDRHCGKVMEFLLLPGNEPQYPGYAARCLLTTLWNGAY
jgi:hypothetical protein